MQTNKVLAFLCCLLFMVWHCPTASAATELILAHVADGGGYRTVILLTNATPTRTTATIFFTGNSGLPMNVSAGDRTANSFSIDLPAGGSAKFQTSGSARDVSVGWARVTASPAVDINGSAVFQLFRDSSLFCEASVPAAAPSSWADFFADETGGFNTGFAMANPGPVPAAGTITLRTMNGDVSGSAPIDLAPGQHSSTFLYQLIPGATSGRAEISLTSGALSITALRYHSSSVFSTLSVGESSVASPQVAALFSPGGGVRSRIVSEIDKARSTIDVAIYSFTSSEIQTALADARSRGVAIRIVADSSQAVYQGSQIPNLEQAGFNVKKKTGLSNGIMHNKYMIIDGNLLLTGSYNWSVSAESYNFENAIFIRGSGVIQGYLTNFNNLWQGR